jgi:carotenoid cleavage dioxygenase
LTNPYLSSGYAPLRTEHVHDNLPVEGTLPHGLTGTYYRIGPSPRFEPRGVYNPLNGDGMVHAFRIAGGKVSYRNRWVRTKQWVLEDEAGRGLFGTSGNPMDHDPSVAQVPTDGVANTNLVNHAGRLLALEEGHVPFALDPATLATGDHWTFAGALPRNMTAHPKIDPATGEMITFANFENIRKPREIGLHVVNATGAIVKSQTIEGPFAALVHDFAITGEFAILAFCPVTVSMKRMMEGKPLIAWEPGLGTQVAIVSRVSGETRWFEGEACMAWHTLNAFNEGDRIVVDVCPQAAPMFPTADGAPPDASRAAQYLTRWEFDWGKPGAFASRRLCEEPCEYPRIDERRTGMRHTSGYLATHGGPGTSDIFQRGIGVYDFEREAFRSWHAGARCAVAEPVYVPGGYLMTIVFDEATGRAHLAILDAEDVEAGPMARAYLPHHMPMGFHGLWVPA